MTTGALRRVGGLSALSMAFALMAGACTSNNDPGQDARSYAVERMGFRTGMGDSFTPPLARTLVDLLPNTTYQEPGKEPVHLSGLVAVGKVTAVERGPGFEGHRNRDGTPVTVPFDDRRAKWNTMHLVLKVRQTWGAEPVANLRVGVTFYPDDDFERFADGLKELGEMVFFLQRTPVYEYNSAVYDSGTVVATVDADGRLALPFLAPANAKAMLGETTTLDSLGRAAEGPGQVIEVERHYGSLYRRGDPAIPAPESPEPITAP